MDSAQLASALWRFLGEDQVVTDESELLCYSYDASFLSQLSPHVPDVVVLPRTSQEVAGVVALAAREGIPVTPRGAATGQTGGCVPVRGGIVVALNRMNRVLEVDAQNLQVIAEPGIVHADLNAVLAPRKLLFPPDPGSSRMCTVGGMVANNAHGMRAMKYGPTGHWVLGLEVVLPDGRIITTGSVDSRAAQSSSGLDLTKLFVGSEGILGIVTKMRLKVLPVPEARAMVMVTFDDLREAGEAVSRTFEACILPSAIEVLDSRAIQAVNLYRPTVGLPQVEAMLLFEVEGNPPGVAYDAQRIASAVSLVAKHVQWADEPRRIAALWEARSLVGAAVGALRPGGVRAYAGEDICVPIDKVPEALSALHALGDEYGIPLPIYGHIGGGNIHAGAVIEVRDPQQVESVLQLADEIHQLALRLHGTVTGEHGVGAARSQYMPAEHGAALDVMWQVKHALDPAGLMNPGKIFPPGFAPKCSGGLLSDTALASLGVSP